MNHLILTSAICHRNIIHIGKLGQFAMTGNFDNCIGLAKKGFTMPVRTMKFTKYCGTTALLGGLQGSKGDLKSTEQDRY